MNDDQSKQLPRKQALDALRKNHAMRHLIEAVEDGTDIGHYGRLTFAIVAHYFMKPDDLAKFLAQDKDESEAEAKGLVHQVIEAGYSPPGPRKIREWNEKQDFPILPPDHDSVDDANVYQDLDFPEAVYNKISSYHEHQAESA